MGDGVGKALYSVRIFLDFSFQAFTVGDVKGVFDHLGDIALFIEYGIRVHFHVSGVAVFIIMDMLDGDRLFGALYFLERTDMFAAVTGELPPVRQSITSGVTLCRFPSRAAELAIIIV